jgi:hypothetical protein
LGVTRDISSAVSVQTATQIVERVDRGTLTVTGPERFSWLNGVLSCDALAAETTGAVWGLALTKVGKILADVVVLNAGDQACLSVPAARARTLCEWLEGFLIMEDADIADVTEDWAWFDLYGPGATACAEQLATDGRFASEVDFGPWIQAAVVAAPRAQRQRCLEVATALRLGVMDADAWQQFRVANFLPVYGADFDDKRSPHEASLDRRAVSWDKGCYLGQEAVCMQDMRGKVKRRLVTLMLGATVPPAPGAAVLVDDGDIGYITSSARASDGRATAIALVKAAYSAAGTHLSVEGAEAEVTPARG